MAVITIKIVVSNLTSIMVNFDKIKVYRSTTGIDGAYTELTVASNRITLVAGQTIYSFTDQNGDGDYYYKSAFYNSTSGLESEQSEAQQGEANAALDIISVEELKAIYLWGLDLTDDAGNPIPDFAFAHYIEAAVDWLEQTLDIAIRLKTITDERHDFIREEQQKYFFMNLFERPVIEVSEILMVLPNEVTVKTFDPTWIHFQSYSGQVQLIPPAGSSSGIALVGVPGTWGPYLWNDRRLVPEVFRVDYSAGFAAGQVPTNIKDIIGKKACFGPLNIAGDLLGGAGIASQNLSIDGLSQGFNTTSSSTNAGYGARLLQYGKEIKEEIERLRRYWSGFKLTVA